MPLTPVKPGTAGFGRNIAEMERAGHPPKQAIAAAYSEAKKAHDARAASVRIIGGEDPKGDQSLQAVGGRPQDYRQQAGQPWSVPSNQSAEPVSQPIVSKTPHEPQTVHPNTVLPSEPLQRVANASGTDRRSIPVLGRDAAGEREEDGGDPEEGMGEGNMADRHLTFMGSAKGIPDGPKPPVVRDERPVHGPDDGTELGSEPVSMDKTTSIPALGDDDEGGLGPTGMDEHVGFKAVEEHAAHEGAKDPAAVAAAAGIKKYGVAGMEKKAHAGKAQDEDLPDPVEEANRVNRSPPVY